MRGNFQVAYLGHLFFSASGMMPDRQKVKAVQQWLILTTVTAILSVYRTGIILQMIHSTIAIPLHHFIQFRMDTEVH